MKMPQIIDSALFAPCGMNCLVCYRYSRRKNPCGGCLISVNQPEHCRKCIIKTCVQAKSLTYCYECRDYPCKRIKSLEKSYNTRYDVSLIENSRYVRQHGLEAFMAWQRTRYTCPSCSGIISLHDGVCSDCQEKQYRQENEI